jgi:hypothetical protein
MSSVETFDGLCGIIATFASSDLQIRCTYELDHYGDCSFEKYRKQFTIQSSCGRDPEEIKEEKFITSVIESMKK